MSKDFESKVKAYINTIIKEEDAGMTPDAQRLKDKMEALKQSLGPVIKAISTAKELEEVLNYIISAMPQIDMVEVKNAFQKVVSGMSSTQAPPPPSNADTMNETFSRIKKSILK
jgi:ERCC4-type nuclease